MSFKASHLEAHQDVIASHTKDPDVRKDSRQVGRPAHVCRNHVHTCVRNQHATCPTLPCSWTHNQGAVLHAGCCSTGALPVLLITVCPFMMPLFCSAATVRLRGNSVGAGPGLRMPLIVQWPPM